MKGEGDSNSGLLYGAGAMGMVLAEAFKSDRYTSGVLNTGITRPLDGEQVRAHAMDAMRNALGVLGFTGTYSTAVRDALKFKQAGDGRPRSGYNNVTEPTAPWPTTAGCHSSPSM